MNNTVTDKTGKETLDVIAEADRFNQWMFQTILPFSKGRILEIGSGVGNISQYFLKCGEKIKLTDLRPEYCDLLKHKFRTRTNLLGIDQLDLTHPNFNVLYEKEYEEYDTVFALNVIEHIENDTLAIENAKNLLKKNGHLIILVPSYQKLYNKFDKELGHHRRYTSKNLSKLFVTNNIEIIHTQYFNFIGIFGWWLSGGLLKKGTIPSDQMKLYNKLVPVWKKIDKLLQNKMGLSTIVVGRK